MLLSGIAKFFEGVSGIRDFKVFKDLRDLKVIKVIKDSRGRKNCNRGCLTEQSSKD